MITFEVDSRRKRGRPRKTSKKQVEEEMKEYDLQNEDAQHREKWHEGVKQIASGN